MQRRRTSVERRALGLVAEARLAVGDYGARPIREEEVGLLARVFNVEFGGASLSVPAVLLPPVEGRYQVIMQEGLNRAVRRYVFLHELGHILAGEADEPLSMVFTGPLPESEDVCDLFALLGIIDEAHILEGGGWLEQQIRELVPLDNYGWQTYRIPRLVKRLPRVREMVGDLHGYF
jgi:hypothetical protein